MSDIQKRHQQLEVDELLDDLFMDWDNHAHKGRDLLRRLQALNDKDCSDDEDGDVFEGGQDHSVGGWETMLSVLRVAEDAVVSA